VNRPGRRDQADVGSFAHGAVREQTRSRLIAALRQRPMTLDQLAAALGLTRTAVRLQVVALERDGEVTRRGVAPGRTKPAQVYELTGEAEQRLSRAYVPVLTQLLHVLAARLPAGEFDGVMREVGRGLLAERARPRGSLRERVAAASELLNQFGGLTRVEEHGSGFVIRSYGCPLAATAIDHPETCNAMESLVSTFVGNDVAQRCDRAGRPRCCFEVAVPTEQPAAGRA